MTLALALFVIAGGIMAAIGYAVRAVQLRRGDPADAVWKPRTIWLAAGITGVVFALASTAT